MPTILPALMKDGHKAKDAIDLIRARRSPHALCNEDFVRYLEDLADHNPIPNESCAE